MKSIYQCVQEIKRREQLELKQAILKYGTDTNGIYEYVFEDKPIIATYLFDSPCDVSVYSVILEQDKILTLMVEDIDCRGSIIELHPDEVFTGQLDFVTSEIS